MTEPEYSTKSAFVAIVGRPNVGKSSLLNALIGEKVAIVSDKPQTTRTRITGVLTRGETQFVFIDTPGLHKPRTRLSEYMVKQVSDSVADVDVALLVVEPQGEIAPAERDLIASFRAQRIPAVLVVNKIDTLANKEKLMPRILAFTKEYEFSAVVPISALTRDGVDAVLGELEAFAAPSPFFFDADTLTDQPERVIVAEIVREKLLRNLRDEIPHGTAVSVESMKERRGTGPRRHRGADLLRAGEPQGDDHRQGRRDAQADRHPGAAGHRTVPRLPGQPQMLGQGARGLAQPGERHPVARLQLSRASV